MTTIIRRTYCAVFGVVWTLFSAGCGEYGGVETGAGPASEPAPVLSQEVVRFIVEGAFDSEGFTTGILRDGEIVYAADGAGGLVILRCSPATGRLSKLSVLKFDVGSESFNAAKVGDYLYVACRTGGLAVVDVQDPAAPVWVKSISSTGKATGVFTDGNRLYVADRDALLIYDITDPVDPVLCGQTNGQAVGVIADGGVAYVASHSAGFSIYDVRDPSKPMLLSTKSVGFAVWSVAKLGDLLYVVGEGAFLAVYDVATPSRPREVARLRIRPDAVAAAGDQNVYAIKLNGKYAFLSGAMKGVYVVDLSNPVRPFLSSTVATDGPCRDLWVGGSKIVTAQGSVGIVSAVIAMLPDIDSDGRPDSEDAFPLDPTEWKDTDKDGIGDNADLDDDNDGVLDVSDAFPLDPNEWMDSDGDGVGDNGDAFPLDPKEWRDTNENGVGDNADPDDDADNIPDLYDSEPLVAWQGSSLSLAGAINVGEVTDVVVGANNLFVVSAGVGIAIVHPLPDGGSQTIGTLVLSGVEKLRLRGRAGNWIFALTDLGTIYPIDIRNEDAPVVGQAFDAGSFVNAVMTSDDLYVYVGTDSNLLALEFQADGSLEQRGAIALGVISLTNMGIGRIGVGTVDAKLSVIDISDPTRMQVGSTIDAGGRISSLGYKDNYLLAFGVDDVLRSAYWDGTNLSLGEYRYLLSAASTGPEIAHQFTLVGNYGFICRGTNEVEIIDVFRPWLPLPFGIATMPSPCLSEGVGTQDLWMACGPSSLQRLSLSGLPDASLRGKWNSKQITQNTGFDDSPKIDRSDIVWRGDSQKSIYFRDGTSEQTRNLTEGLGLKFVGVPSLKGGQVAWRVWDGADKNAIYFWDGTMTQNIHEYGTGSFPQTTGYPPSYNCLEVSLDRGHIVWAEWDGADYEIMLWDGASVSQLTENAVDDYEPQIANGRVSWTTAASTDTGTINVIYWDGSIINNISQSNFKAEDSNLDDKTLTWIDWSPGSVSPSVLQFDVFYWDGVSTYSLEVNGSDFEPYVSGKNIAWNHLTDRGGFDVYVWDGLHVVNVTGDPVNEHQEVSISGNQLVYRARELGADPQDFEIFLGTFTLDGGDLSLSVVPSNLVKKR